ncbi:type I restriction endonuclease [Chelatococcus sambhunathii]|uniref:type I restriction endonuclease n=1 Tax=Chelatococcus sambhunathii TaxID=363953 RepID=UPI0028528B27|nr:type I restriction endonuclease [Chelatococcus sambhunathii]
MLRVRRAGDKHPATRPARRELSGQTITTSRRTCSAPICRRGATRTRISPPLCRGCWRRPMPPASRYTKPTRAPINCRAPVPVPAAVGRSYKTVHLVDWERPELNDFALAEETTLRGGHERRPDLLVYLNGIAVGVIELKRSSVEVTDGVSQALRELRASHGQIRGRDGRDARLHQRGLGAAGCSPRCRRAGARS